MTILGVLFVAAATFSIGFLLLMLLSYWRYQTTAFRDMPGTPWHFHPIIGDVGEHYRFRERGVDMQANRVREYGSVSRSLYYLGCPRLRVGHPEYAKSILKTSASKYHKGSFMGAETLIAIAGSDNILMASGDTSKKLRRIASPAFKPKVLADCVPDIVANADKLAQNWAESLVNGKAEISVKSDLLGYTLDTLIATMGLGEGHAVDTIAIRNGMEQILDRTILSYLGLIPCYKQVMSFLHNALLGQVDLPAIPAGGILLSDLQRTLRLIKNNVERLRNCPLEQKGFLHTIFANLDGNVLTESEMTDLIIVFFLAGTETSSNAITWTLWLLAGNQRLQDEVAEQCKAFDYEGISWETVMDKEDELELVWRVVRESLRLYPPVPYVSREAIKDDMIEGYTIPRGTDTVVDILAVHRNRDVWGEDADELNPFRDYPPDAFMPFSEGAHKCIGYQLAELEIRIALIKLLREFAFERPPDDKTEARAVVTLMPDPPLKLVMTRRE